MILFTYSSWLVQHVNITYQVMLRLRSLLLVVYQTR